jgi:hypothetical protein
LFPDFTNFSHVSKFSEIFPKFLKCSQSFLNVPKISRKFPKFPIFPKKKYDVVSNVLPGDIKKKYFVIPKIVPRFHKISQNTPKFPKFSQISLIFAIFPHIFKDFSQIHGHNFVRFFREFLKVVLRFPKFSQMFPKFPKCSQNYLNFPKCAQNVPIFPKKNMM